MKIKKIERGLEKVCWIVKTKGYWKRGGNKEGGRESERERERGGESVKDIERERKRGEEKEVKRQIIKLSDNTCYQTTKW